MDGKELVGKDKVEEMGLASYEDLKNWELLVKPEEKAIIAASLKAGDKLPTGMSKFQIANFVLSDENFPTPDSKFWQCRLELWTRIQGVMANYFTFRKEQAELEILEGKLEVWHEDKGANPRVRDGNIKLKEVEIEEKQYKLFTISKAVNETLREMNVYKIELEKWQEQVSTNPDDKESQEMSYWLGKAKSDQRLNKYMEKINKASEEKCQPKT